MLARERSISNIHSQSNTIILVKERSINIALLIIGCWMSVCSVVCLIIMGSLSLTPIVEYKKKDGNIFKVYTFEGTLQLKEGA